MRVTTHVNVMWESAAMCCYVSVGVVFTVLMFGPLLCFGFKYRTQRVPELIPKPTVAQLLDETTTRRVYIYGIQDDNGTDVQNFSLDLTPPPDVIMKTSPGTSEGMNVLGIVIFSATMGKCFVSCTHTFTVKCTMHIYMYNYMHMLFVCLQSRNNAGQNGAQWKCSGQLLSELKRGSFEDCCYCHMVRALFKSKNHQNETTTSVSR